MATVSSGTLTVNAGFAPGDAPEHVFEIKFRKGGKTSVRAAYAQHGATAAHAATPGAATADTPVVLKDADNKIVFLAPTSVIQSVTRAGRHPAGAAL